MGQMNKPLFDVLPKDFEAEINSYIPGNGLVWQKLFPLKFTPKFDLKGIEGNEGIPVSADRVAFNTKAPLKTRKTVGTWSGTLGKIAISREKGEIEINEYKDLKNSSAVQAQDSATKQYLFDLVYDDVKFCNNGTDYKIEIDALRIGSSGLQTFPAEIEGELATADVINFNVPAANFVGVTKAWSDPTADGIADIVAKQKAISKTGMKKPLFAIIEQATFDKLLAQTATTKKVASVLLNVTGLASTEVLSVDNVNSYMRSKGYPQFLVIDSYATIQGKDGSENTIKPWNENVVTLAPVAQLGWTYFKPVPMVENTDALQQQGAYAKTTIYSEVNPMLETTMAEAYVQAGLINRASLVFLNTNNAAWNNGQ